MTNDNNKKTFSMIWKLIIGTGILVSLFVGMFNVDAHFAKTSQLNALEIEIEEDTNHKLLLAEAEAVTTMQGMQQEQQQTYKSIYLNIFIIQKEALNREDVRLRRQIRLYPNDIELKNQLDDNKRLRIDIQKSINKSISIK
jgi:hypothetical protein